jgi:hypothetical protein
MDVITTPMGHVITDAIRRATESMITTTDVNGSVTAGTDGGVDACGVTANAGR